MAVVALLPQAVVVTVAASVLKAQDQAVEVQAVAAHQTAVLQVVAVPAEAHPGADLPEAPVQDQVSVTGVARDLPAWTVKKCAV